MHNLQIRALNFIALPGIKTSNPGILKIFDETIPPLVILEHAALAAYFMTEKSWTFCPYTTAIRLQKMELAFTNLRILLQSRWYIIW